MAAVLNSFVEQPISPLFEMGAYEFLWLQPSASFARLAELFHGRPGALPSNFVASVDAERTAAEVLAEIKSSGIGSFGIRINGASQYPERLRDARHPVELLYYQGAWELTDAPKTIAIVGTRKPSANGIARTKRITRDLVSQNYTIVSGLASGIDTIAHQTALECGGQTIAVIGTPITESYPPENKSLQLDIAKHFLVVSQVPILRYKRQTWKVNRFYFPERNKTMSALTQATVIIEASETSGTLVQARAALQQGRKLFILDSCFNDPRITWPARFAEKGAIRVKDIEDIKWGLDGA